MSSLIIANALCMLGLTEGKKMQCVWKALDEQALLCDPRASGPGAPNSILKLKISPLTFVLTKEHMEKICQKL